MSKIATDIEQSKKLLELGIDVGTSDMAICHYGYIDRLLPNGDMDTANMESTPAWSLAALIALLPEEIILGDKYFLEITNNACAYSSTDDYHICYNTSGESTVDAVFKMIVWLKENNLL